MTENKRQLLDQFDQECKKKQDELETQAREALQGSLLYHFRKPDRAIEILKGRELWFSDYRYLQKEHDKDEMDLGFRAILECIAGRSKKAEDFWYQFGGNFAKLMEQHSIYVLSLCKTIQSPKVWEKYGDVALGFNFTSSVSSGIPVYDQFYLLDVSYKKEQFSEIINAFFGIADRYVDRLQNDEGKKEFATALASHLCAYIPMLKGDEFEWEQEYRLVMPGLYLPDGNRFPCALPIERLRFVQKKHPSTHFVQPLNPLDLKEICFKPRINPDSKTDVKIRW